MHQHESIATGDRCIYASPDPCEKRRNLAWFELQKRFEIVHSLDSVQSRRKDGSSDFELVIVFRVEVRVNRGLAKSSYLRFDRR